MNRFKGNNAIVTGASRGIGAAIAERLAAEGANVVLVARTLEVHDHLPGSLSETREKCRSYGSTVEAISADLSDEDQRSSIVPKSLEILDGRIDILVNDAAAAIYAPMLTFPLRRRRVIFEVNVHATADLMQAVIPAMMERHEGWIVNVSSAGAKYESGVRMGAFDQGIYRASKAALNVMTLAFADELTGSGIRVNTVAPRGAVLSEGAVAVMKGTLSDDIAESMEAMVEGAIALCDCAEESTGGIHYSLDLLEALGTTVMTLDGSAPYPGGFRIHRA